MKKSALIYLIYLVFILSITALLSIYIIGGEIKILPIKSFLSIKEIKKSQFINFLKVQEELQMSFDYQRNFLNFHDVEWKIEKPLNTYRIIALGDSFTDGFGVIANDTWPKQLEKKLNNLNFDYDFEVLNMGHGSWGTYEEVEVFQELGLKFNPDMIILQHYPGDWKSPELNIKANELWEEVEKGGVLPPEIEQIIEKIGVSRLPTSTIIYSYLEHKYFEDNILKWEKEWDRWTKNSLINLIKICHEKDIKLIVVGWDFLPEYILEKKKLMSLLKDHHIIFHDFTEYLPHPGPGLCNSTIRLLDCHLNAIGYEIVANKTLTIVSEFIKKD